MMRLLSIIFSCLLAHSAMAQIIKSPIDDKEYRYLQLENELSVLLINDKDVDVSAASLDVAIGSASNPDEWLGLAHFLEHMLFLGSKKYPIVGQYSQFIKTNGGSMNAYTAPHNTNYYFSIDTAKLEPALDRFSRFFIDPTFNPDFVDRERHVVHSEYEARRKSEGMRIYSTGQELMNSAHPLSRFTIGTIETLADKKGKTVREALIEFYEKYYSANLMTLVVISNKSLDTLESWVTEKFSQIPNRNVERPIFDVPYFDSEGEARLLLIKPEKDLYQVQYEFPMPSTYAEYDTKPANLLASIIGNETEGSLLAMLREKGYATSLSSGMSYSDPAQSVFNIRIGLTEKGAKHLDQIHQWVFAQIKLTEQGIEKWRYEEAAQLAKMKFRFKQEQKSINLASQLARLMQDIPVEDVLQYPFMYEKFDAQRTRELFQYLNPDNVYISVVSPDVQTDLVSAFFDVEYALLPLSKTQKEKWKAIDQVKALKLPEKNPYIAERLQLLVHEQNAPLPEKLKMAKDIEVWYQADSDFNSPRANLFVALMNKNARADVNQVVLMEQWLQIVRNRLKKQTYAAMLASLNYEIYSHLRGISLRIGGFEDKQTELLSLILGELAQDDFRQDEFNTFKNELLRNWRNVDKEAVQNRVFQAFWREMVRPSYSEAEKIAALESLSVKDLKKWHNEFFSKIYLRILSHGDVSKKVSEQRVNLIKAWLRDGELIDEPVLPKPLDLRHEKIWLKTLDIEHNDSSLVLYYQGQNDSIDEHAKMRLLSNLISSDYYNELRTNNRVGYIVFATDYSVLDRPGMLFFAQSPTHAPSVLKNLSQAFFNEFQNKLKKYDKEQFSQVKKALINNILAPDETLAQRSKRFWRDLDRKKHGFAYRDKLIKALQQLTLEDLQEFYQHLILENDRVMFVQSLGQGTQKGELIDEKDYILVDQKDSHDDG